VILDAIQGGYEMSLMNQHHDIQESEISMKKEAKTMRHSMTYKLFLLVMSGLSLMLLLNPTAFAQKGQEKAEVSPWSLVKERGIRDKGHRTNDQTAFTYQGQLKDANGPVNGSFDFQFVLYSAQTDSEPLGVSEMEDITLTNGMFSFKLDFGRAAVEAKESWLEIGVRQSGSSEPYTVLFPRQKLTPTPYAIFAQHEQWSLIGVPIGFADRVQTDVNMAPPTNDATETETQATAAPAGVEWTRDGAGNLYPTNLTDRVGIGTNSPVSTLDVRGRFTLDPGVGNPVVLYTAASGGEQNRYLELINAPSFSSASGLKAGGILVSDNYSFAQPRKNDLIVKGVVGIGTANPFSELHIHGLNPFITLSTAAGDRAFIQNAGGSLVFKPTGFGVNDAAMVMRANTGNIGIGSADPKAKLEVASGSGDIFRLIGYEPFITFFDSNHGYVRGAIQQVDGGLNLFTDSYLRGANPLAYLRLDNSGNVGIGTATPQAKLDVVGMTRTGVLQITGGADLSEQFEVSATTNTDDASSEQILPGMVVSIDPDNPGKLVVSNQVYDRRVAGIISGAGGIKPGLLMSQSASLADGSHPVALTGRVYCFVDASYGPVEPGDLLTTSDTPGHAMKVTDHALAHGAIIGKAMTSLKEGKGLVLVLVTLQ
jgi:hypothetical protein